MYREVLGAHLTQSRLGSVQSGILIHAAIWPQRIWAESWGYAPLGELDLHLT